MHENTWFHCWTYLTFSRLRVFGVTAENQSLYFCRTLYKYPVNHLFSLLPSLYPVAWISFSTALWIFFAPAPPWATLDMVCTRVCPVLFKLFTQVQRRVNSTNLWTTWHKSAHISFNLNIWTILELLIDLSRRAPSCDTKCENYEKNDLTLTSDLEVKYCFNQKKLFLRLCAWPFYYKIACSFQGTRIY